MTTMWIWQRPDWPAFRWEQASLAPLLRACVQAQGHLVGLASAESEPERADDALDTLLASVITSSAIEGERLNVASVRSSLARRLGMDAPVAISARSEGLADLTLDAITQHDQPLDLQRLLQWHRWLFPADDSFLPSRIRDGRKLSSAGNNQRCHWSRRCRSSGWSCWVMASRVRSARPSLRALIATGASMPRRRASEERTEATFKRSPSIADEVMTLASSVSSASSARSGSLSALANPTR